MTTADDPVWQIQGYIDGTAWAVDSATDPAEVQQAFETLVEYGDDLEFCGHTTLAAFLHLRPHDDAEDVHGMLRRGSPYTDGFAAGLRDACS